jgi:hypothetical protein
MSDISNRGYNQQLALLKKQTEEARLFAVECRLRLERLFEEQEAELARRHILSGTCCLLLIRNTSFFFFLLTV